MKLRTRDVDINIMFDQYLIIQNAKVYNYSSNGVGVFKKDQVR